MTATRPGCSAAAMFSVAVVFGICRLRTVRIAANLAASIAAATVKMHLAAHLIARARIRRWRG